METEKAVVVRDNHEIFALPEIDSLKAGLEQVRKFQAAVKSLLIQGHDYGVIPGTDKPTLLKPGAEKIDKLLKLADLYEEIDKVENWDKPLFYYKIKCRLVIMGTDVVVSEGMGSCNSMENKYRYRWVFQSKLPDEYQGEANKAARASLVTRTIRTKNGLVKQYRLDNEDIYSLANTILKMAKKRAHIDASLSAGRLSDVFTQDIEDLADTDAVVEEDTSDTETPKPKTAAKKEETRASTPAPDRPARDPQSIKTINELMKACHEDFNLQPKQVLAELNVNSQSEISMKPAECYQQIASSYASKEEG